MSRRGSRGTAGTLRRLGPRPRASRPRRQPLCSILTGQGFLSAIAPNSTPIFDGDITRALRLSRDTARQVCVGLIELGYSAELVGAPR